MKIQIPKVVLAVSIVEYAAELEGKYLHVWVNPPKAKLQEYDELVRQLQARELESARQTLLPDGPTGSNGADALKGQTILARTFDQVAHWLKIRQREKPEGIDRALLEWYAEIWSQGPQDTQWTVEELRTLEEQDPAFLSWMIAQTWKTRAEHVERKKKT